MNMKGGAWYDGCANTNEDECLALITDIIQPIESSSDVVEVQGAGQDLALRRLRVYMKRDGDIPLLGCCRSSWDKPNLLNWPSDPYPVFMIESMVDAGYQMGAPTLHPPCPLEFLEHYAEISKDDHGFGRSFAQ